MKFCMHKMRTYIFICGRLFWEREKTHNAKWCSPVQRRMINVNSKIYKIFPLSFVLLILSVWFAVAHTTQYQCIIMHLRWFQFYQHIIGKNNMKCPLSFVNFIFMLVHAMPFGSFKLLFASYQCEMVNICDKNVNKFIENSDDIINRRHRCMRHEWQ